VIVKTQIFASFVKQIERPYHPTNTITITA
jgi:hypothetical protein